ncbi:hypothetical protein ANO11243_030260 [Dothideomycetidae sp. 11243]|nr:hypothetical protein ANO11243_030260 [fungal sp. No.11243]
MAIYPLSADTAPQHSFWRSPTYASRRIPRRAYKGHRVQSQYRSAGGIILPSPGDEGFERAYSIDHLERYLNRPLVGAIMSLENGTFGNGVDADSDLPVQHKICYWEQATTNPYFHPPREHRLLFEQKLAWAGGEFCGTQYVFGNEGVANGQGPDPYGEYYSPFALFAHYDVQGVMLKDSIARAKALQKSNYAGPGFTFICKPKTQLFLSSDQKTPIPHAQRRKIHEQFITLDRAKLWCPPARAQEFLDESPKRRKAANSRLLHDVVEEQDNESSTASLADMFQDLNLSVDDTQASELPTPWTPTSMPKSSPHQTRIRPTRPTVQTRNLAQVSPPPKISLTAPSQYSTPISPTPSLLLEQLGSGPGSPQSPRARRHRRSLSAAHRPSPSQA